MRAGVSILFAALMALAFAWPVAAVEPEEMLADPVLEARAQALDEAIRCVQCQSESIAASNAGWARDARLMVRELITEGASDQAVLDFFETRYGERVLMQPRQNGSNLALWLAGPVIFLLSIVGFGVYQRRSERKSSVPLSPEEEARLRALIDPQEDS